jgi:hypothetical protein
MNNTDQNNNSQPPIIPSIPTVKFFPGLSNLSTLEQKSMEPDEKKHSENKKKIVIPKPSKTLLKLKNPYEKLDDEMLKIIITNRGYGQMILNDRKYNLEILKNLDENFPKWLKYVYKADINNMTNLNKDQLMLYAIINDIDIKFLDNFNIYDVKEYIKINHYKKINDTQKLQDIVKNLNKTILQRFYLDFLEKYRSLISIEDIKTYIITNSDKHIDYKSIDKKLMREYKLQNTKHKDIIFAIYDIKVIADYNMSFEDDYIRDILKLKPHPLEDIILNIDDMDLSKLVQKWDIVVPKQYTLDEDKYKKYIVNNILAYKNILTRGRLKSISLEELSKMNEPNIREYLNKLTDREIFNLIEAYIYFDSRETLIGNIIETFTKPGFLLPLKRTRRRGLNKEGFTANFADVFEDTSLTILGYGTILQYNFFSIEELNQKWNVSRDLPTDDRNNDKITHISIENEMYLKKLLENIDVYPQEIESKNGIISIIDLDIKSSMSKYGEIPYDNKAKARLAQFTDDEKTKIMDILTNIFYTGWIMRRWQGPGHPFPYKSSQAQGADPDNEVTKKFKEIYDSLNENKKIRKFIFELAECNYDPHTGKYFQSNSYNIKKILYEVRNPNTGQRVACIRLSSRPLIITTFHYLASLFDVVIPNFDIDAIKGFG